MKNEKLEIPIHIRRSQICITRICMLLKICILTLKLIQETELSAVGQEQGEWILLRLKWI